MSEITRMSDIADQVMKYWSPLGINKLKQDALLPSMVNKDYEGNLAAEGDTVYVSEVNVPNASRKQTGSGEESFEATKVSTTRVAITANQTITAAFELQSLTQIESQIKMENSAIREALVQSLEIALNEYLYSLVAPSTSAPDHVINGVSDFNASELLKVRGLAAAARWAKDSGWMGLVDPSYYNDLLNATTLTSKDYIGDSPVINGQIAMQRFGFNLFEDNSNAILGLSPAKAGADVGLFFHRDFLHLVMPQSITFKVSDLHSNKQHGYLLSAHMVVGAALGCNGSKKHILVYNT